MSGVRAVLTISRLKAGSMAYYNDTSRAAMNAAADRQRAGGGLGEYYSESETRAPVWMLSGDAEKAATLTGLSASDRAGGVADLDVVERWIVDGVAPNGATGRAFRKRDNHGFDLTFCAPKSVSLARAVGGDEVLSKAIADAHTVAVGEALEYLHTHAGYTRVHNPVTGKKDLVRLSGLVTAAYQHETSRAGDPHLHTHVLVPNKQARDDGVLVSIDSKSLHHEAKTAGIVYQATLRHELHQSMGLEWEPVDPHTGQADIAGIDPDVLTAWSQRSTQLREWAAANLVCEDPDNPTAAQLATAQKATRPRKPENLSWAELKAQWAADERGFAISEQGQAAARHARRTAPGNVLTAARAAAADITKPAFTRADLIEAIGARLPVAIDGAPDGPRILMEVLADRIAVPLTAPREAHEREGHERFTTAPIIAEEAAIVALMGASNPAAALPASAINTEGLSAEQARAITAIATTPWLVQPLSAPAGAGKTTSLRALREAVARSPRHDRVRAFAPTGKAVDVAVREHAGDTGTTVAAALKRLRNGSLTFDERTVVVVDEAGMVGTPALRVLLAATTAAGAKTVLVGDAHQLAPVKSRGGMFEQLCADLPWTQHLTEVWRMHDPEERTASLGLGHGGGATRRRAVDWYRRHDRLATGDAPTMADDAVAAYTRDRTAGKDTLVVADSWEMCDAVNTRIHNDAIAPDAPTVAAARGHRLAVGDVVISRRNDPTIALYGAHGTRQETDDPVRNGHRWDVIDVDPETGRVAARRLSDRAHAVFAGDYLRTHVHLGYAVTVQAAQGTTVDTTHALLSDRAHKGWAYVGLTRGRDANHAYLYTTDAEEADHAHAERAPGIHVGRRGTARDAAAMLAQVVGRDTRDQTAAVTAADTDRALLPEPVVDLLEARTRARAAARIAHHHHLTERAQAADRARAERAVAAELPMLAAEVSQIEVSWQRSPATVYPPPAQGWEDLDDTTRAAVATITASMQNVQVLTVGSDTDKHAALAAVTAAVHGRNKHVLAVPATRGAAAEATDQPYAERVAGPRQTRDRIDNGKWTIPAGNLLIIDDADHLDPKLLRYFTDHATATNTKLLLVHTPTPERQPGHTVVQTLAETLPWTQHIGTESTPQAYRTATERVTELLGEPHTGAPSQASSAAAELLDRRSRVLDTYQKTQARNRRWTDRHAQQERERAHNRGRGGLEL
ncbi:TrwC relaxase [Mycolicibacterium rhodesiae JS60]|nr:TrwC relaxase [Mycolicibacterium rhodesiae JS60]